MKETHVHIYFKTNKLKQQCSEAREMLKAFGKKMSLKVQQRLVELSAVENLAEIWYLPPARCHQLANTGGVFSVDLEYPYRLLLIPADESILGTADGGIDVHKVTAIKILAIEDTHDPKNQRKGRL